MEQGDRRDGSTYDIEMETLIDEQINATRNEGDIHLLLGSRQGRIGDLEKQVDEIKSSLPPHLTIKRGETSFWYVVLIICGALVGIAVFFIALEAVFYVCVSIFILLSRLFVSNSNQSH